MVWPKPNGIVVRGPTPAPGTARLAAVSGGLVSLVLLFVMAGVAVVFAAAFAVMLVLGVVMTALSAAAWRMRPRPAPACTRAGHAWIHYGPAGRADA